MNKMREEFEVWAVTYNLARADWGNYSDRHVNNMWKSWKASRAALCVELPKQYSTDSIGSAYCVDAVIDSLYSAGVRYK